MVFKRHYRDVVGYELMEFGKGGDGPGFPE